MQDYDEALSFKPGHILAHLRKGMVLQALKRPEVMLLHAQSQAYKAHLPAAQSFRG